MNQLKLLKTILLLCSAYYLIAAFAHFFGLTLFPFYDGQLYSAYHDTLLALCDLIFALLFFKVARNPIKNHDTLQVMIIGFVLVILMNLGIIWKIDFVALGSYQKKFQTIIETILATIAFVFLVILKPKTNTK